MAAPVRVVLAVADDVVRQAVAAVLECDGDCAVVDRARTRGEAVLGAWLQRPDVALLDAALPDHGAVQATRLIAGRQPSVAIALLADSEEAIAVHAGSVTAAIRLGARGYVVRSDPADEVVAAVRELAVGGVAVTPMFARDLLRALFHGGTPSGRGGLSADDQLILGLRGRGWSLPGIAERMALSPEAVRAALRGALEVFRAEQDDPLDMLGAPVPRRPLPPSPALTVTAQPPREDTSAQAGPTAGALDDVCSDQPPPDQ